MADLAVIFHWAPADMDQLGLQELMDWRWVIESLSENKTIFFSDGTPRRIEFTLSLKRTDDDRIDLLGAGTSIGVNILRGLL